MAEIEPRTKVEAQATLRLSEAEMRALAKISEWDVEAVVTAIEKVVSPSELKPFRNALIEFLSTAGGHLSPILRRADDARAVFIGASRAVSTSYYQQAQAGLSLTTRAQRDEKIASNQTGPLSRGEEEEA